MCDGPVMTDERDVLMLLLPQLRSDGRSGKRNMEVGVLLGVVVLMVLMVTVAEGVEIVVVGSVQRE